MEPDKNEEQNQQKYVNQVKILIIFEEFPRKLQQLFRLSRKI
jgi:hypothetical protein